MEISAKKVNFLEIVEFFQYVEKTSFRRVNSSSTSKTSYFDVFQKIEFLELGFFLSNTSKRRFFDVSILRHAERACFRRVLKKSIFEISAKKSRIFGISAKKSRIFEK